MNISHVTYKELEEFYHNINNYDIIYSSKSDSDISIDNISNDDDIDDNREYDNSLSSYYTNTHLGDENFHFNKDFLKSIVIVRLDRFSYLIIN